MIRGVHAMFYSSQAEELRAFLRDNLSLPFSDVGGGWLIFDLAEAEMGVHPADESHAHSRAGMHSISFYCDDIQRTVADLKAKGIEFTNEIADQGYGLVTQFKMPGGVVVDLYQPQYTKQTTPKPVMPARPVQARPVKPLKPSLNKPQRKARTALKKKVTTKKAAAKGNAAKKVMKKKTMKAASRSGKKK
jgi:glyoxalase/bleomycin resistance protein/dioxygenase superfamily protein